MLMIHKTKCEHQRKLSIRTSNESHFHWKKHFHKNPIHFTIIADFEADNEIDSSIKRMKTAIIHKNNPVYKGYYIVSDLEHALKSGIFSSFSDYDNVE